MYGTHNGTATHTHTHGWNVLSIDVL
jgi:hypothetical protein